ncbi:uncharacterized protein Gasu_23600 [Galdieria sulphuraria]|uniref:Inositol-pentakisphosphate 2-kinase n=1 Tax=Galdieria sulphuraria TaxID=130081 RepID=M2Y2M8_GALSU|nr:uncharacterized protein Gasu_23600 [Galdieria sulphuraria]EME30203.1 hypothetical protein Gasu_23600 [Galdieria sulphuraria]|eukprot:XP_005706723.1 hypothetical protein Gasu_23600 [Galdieria sulphuraria]
MSWVEEEEWKYFRCGGRHILFEPMGKQPLSKGLLLRVRRQDARQFTSLEVTEEQRFVRDFFGTNIGFHYLPKAYNVSVSTGFLCELSRSLHCQLVEGKDVDVLSKSVILIRDQRKVPCTTAVCSEDCICIEWKPKYMLLPRSRLVPAPISQYKYRYYRSNLKNFQSEDSLVYTPEDILSFQHDRIRRALVSLIRQKSKYLQLLHPHQPEPISSTILETKLDILVHIICKEAILFSRLRMIQQLDILDYEGAKLALEALETLKDSDLEKLEKKIYGKSFTPGWLKEELLYLNSFHDMIFDSDEEETRMHWCLTGDIQKLERSFLQGLSCLHSLESGELERILGDFLYSTITKDCSLLISFVQVSENSNCYLSDMWKPIYIEQRMYYYSISVIDLEPKSLKKLKIWLENDQFLFQFP